MTGLLVSKHIVVITHPRKEIDYDVNEYGDQYWIGRRYFWNYAFKSYSRIIAFPLKVYPTFEECFMEISLKYQDDPIFQIIYPRNISATLISILKCELKDKNVFRRLR